MTKLKLAILFPILGAILTGGILCGTGIVPTKALSYGVGSRVRSLSVRSLTGIFPALSPIPQTMEELLTLPGIGRKTANLLLGDLYGKPAVVTDTHFIRICGRLGLTKHTEPQKVEEDLRKLLPPKESSDFCHRIVLFGREFCKARKPVCASCPLREICPSKDKP